jgi:gluconate 2-dehydrogenase gamma chain
MTEQGFGRRDFLKGAVVGGAAAATTSLEIQGAQAQQPAASAAPAAGYEFLNLEEAAFVEALVDHMIPADEFTPKGTDLGLNVYIDRALAGGWGKGESLYVQGPWKKGVPSQGYQLPLVPADLYRAGIGATNIHCRKAYGKGFDRLDAKQREEVLVGLSTGKVTFDSGLPVRDRALPDGDGGHVLRSDLWRQPQQGGVADDVEKFRDKPFPTDPMGIADLS